MHIAMDARTLARHHGGVTTYITCLSRALAALGHQVDLLSMEALTEFGNNPRVILSKDTIGPIKYRQFWEQILLPLKTQQTDILHLTSKAVIPLVRTCPIVCTIHDLYCFAMPDLYPEKPCERLRKGFAGMAERCDKIITVSEYSKSDIVKYLGTHEDKIKVTHLAPAIGMERVSDTDELKATRKKLELPDRFILCVGGKNTKCHKNTHKVIEALAILPTQYYDVHLVMAGTPSQYVETSREVAERLSVSQRVRYTGFVDERTLACLYNLASVFMFPSLYEGFGIPILEAMTCGTPVITSNRGAMKEVAADAALLVNPENADDISHAIEQILSDPACSSDYSARGLAHAAQFTWEKTALGTLEAYASVCR